MIGGAGEVGDWLCDWGEMRAGVFLRWMGIQDDVNLGLGLTNVTISMCKFKPRGFWLDE